MRLVVFQNEEFHNFPFCNFESMKNVLYYTVIYILICVAVLFVNFLIVSYLVRLNTTNEIFGGQIEHAIELLLPSSIIGFFLLTCIPIISYWYGIKNNMYDIKISSTLSFILIFILDIILAYLIS
jgi:heme/copper-type cytochrome/quinol oxidase subunit 2